MLGEDIEVLAVDLVPLLSFHRLAPLTAVLATLAVAATTCAYATAIRWYCY